MVKAVGFMHYPETMSEEMKGYICEQIAYVGSESTLAKIIGTFLLVFKLNSLLFWLFFIHNFLDKLLSNIETAKDIPTPLRKPLITRAESMREEMMEQEFFDKEEIQQDDEDMQQEEDEEEMQVKGANNVESDESSSSSIENWGRTQNESETESSHDESEIEK